MNYEDLKRRRPVNKDRDYLAVKNDHLSIGANDRATAAVYACLEFKAFFDGAGDTEFLPFTMASLIKWLGPLRMSKDSALARVRWLIDRWIILEGPRSQGNVRSMRINWDHVTLLLEVNDVQRAQHFERLNRVLSFGYDESALGVGIAEAIASLRAQTEIDRANSPTPVDDKPSNTSRIVANPYIGITNKQITTSKSAATHYAGFTAVKQTIHELFPGTDDDMIHEILSVGIATRPDITDSEFSAALRTTKRLQQTSAALWRKTVPTYLNHIGERGIVPPEDSSAALRGLRPGESAFDILLREKGSGYGR